MKTIGYAAHNAQSNLEPFHFEHRALRENDVAIEILYSGICHSDLHQVHDDWGGSLYPMVPGHEIVGRVIEVGSQVKNYAVGDSVAVGCMVDSCQSCDQCDAGEEQFCRKGMTPTYNGKDRHTGELTYGGYAKHIVVREEFVLRVPDALDITRAAPILCAGITTYSPLKEFNVTKGSRVGVVGLGGLGHMAVKLAKALGATVTVITHSASKIDQAKTLGAQQTLLSSDQDAMQAASGSLDLIINTVPVKHDLNPYLPLLDVKGMMVMVGQIGPVEEPNIAPMIMGRRGIVGSLIGGIPQTQEVLDFCAKHDIHPECELIKMQDINDAFKRLANGEVSHRLVIDMQNFSG
ncbi:NAD(P)-dependent alcohol dehydrogenase [Pleionea litopenaei]|uniref:NAD(P)-dependent alcohol dehydrogenase n=1 Tax=Pleionea litopenaei TaxID=3070815 RepID=A0AA51RUK9_9GAMM|nr:NAD(P)-dependent alcohol dehydrogenase [Pleionea sp. HL-JVS1]WMS87800.1 NAD(P)-dependent alcohol dehydrogenase [Pleionea sp. HL-JVS1]